MPAPTDVAFAEVFVEAFVSASEFAALVFCAGSSCDTISQGKSTISNAMTVSIVHTTHLSNRQALRMSERALATCSIVSLCLCSSCRCFLCRRCSRDLCEEPPGFSFGASAKPLEASHAIRIHPTTPNVLACTTRLRMGPDAYVEDALESEGEAVSGMTIEALREQSQGRLRARQSNRREPKDERRDF